MAKASPSTNAYLEQVKAEDKEIEASLKREMLFLTRQVGRNPLATGYYIQLKELLEDLLMLELAQRAAEATMKFYTRNKTLVINDQSLVPFRSEMEKAKTLKLVSGVLSLSGCLDVESVLDKVTTAIYGPKHPSKQKDDNTVEEIRKIVTEYAKRIEKAMTAKI